MIRRGFGSPTLFAIVYSAIASSIYFALGVVADHALGLTPVVFLVAGFFYLLTTMTYVEGASLHQERGGSTVFARYAFNELVSFIAGWAILLDYVILIALTAFTATNYLAAFWAPFGRGAVETGIAVAIVLYVALINVRGISASIIQRRAIFAVLDFVVQLVVIVLGLILVFSPDVLTDPIDLGTSPDWGDLVFAGTIAVVAFTGLESASGLAGEVAVGRRGLKRLVAMGSIATMVTYVGMGLIAVTALPVVDGRAPFTGDQKDAPVLAVVDAYDPTWLSDLLRYTVATSAVLVLAGACIGAMLGLSRLGYSLATNRQIPSAVGRLHPTRGTPYVIIAIAGVLAAGLVIPSDLDMLVGVYAFGALLAFSIAHVSVIALRFREPDRDRPYRIPLSVRVRGADLPLPAVVGGASAAAAWVSVLIQHTSARWVGLAWMAAGIALYVIYRKTESKPLLKRVTIPEKALRSEPAEVEYGSILVPIFGRPLDDDIMQTAGRLAGDEDEEGGEGGAVIEALWVFEVPLSLPIDARVPEGQLKAARQALARAKAVGEEYEGVEVATATVRARRAGQAIVEEARRRGVEAIVLAAEEPSRIRGGALLGGRGGPMDNFVGDVTKYVIEKAPCRVILTAPPADRDKAEGSPDGGPEVPLGTPVTP
jgi:APA family basic amino acid/polyamine antiporter